MRSRRAEGQRGRKDSAETRRRKSEATTAAHKRSAGEHLEPPLLRVDPPASPHGITPPTAATLRKYGLTAEEWLALLEGQGWRCPVCRRPARTLRLNIDHDHVPMWAKLQPEDRKRYVRGVLCTYCNFRRVNSRMPADEAARIAAYLAAYEARRDA